eukprot:CAMPEP_0174296098 /NCGR_PEP_ID=MMETSP0809-20121228/46892_1 /TAXON_ID=73025 ORGANISM="Eutreptiella gymnastica-like, Strain CCMP1594" /NCGR_SAMPLE_ID=MMETSP0809 /ASSEMBLY_ACC=CAM_ASM_000658 /LENGTH=258 /DNA_ID=CAMNT_0015398875 /DNA_START=37 /DNA_END=813 /DNA_ORIENTATION=-
MSYYPENSDLLPKHSTRPAVHAAVAAMAAFAGCIATLFVLGSHGSLTMLINAQAATTRPATVAASNMVDRVPKAPRAMAPTPMAATTSGATATDVPETMPLQTPQNASNFTAGVFAVVSGLVTGAVAFVFNQRRKIAQSAVAGAAAGAVSLSAIDVASAAPQVNFAPQTATQAPALFAKACVACHVGGGNLLIEGHTLSRTAMEKYLEGGWTKEAIEYQIRNGKGPMPAWQKVLNDEQIGALRDYVYDQSTTEWADVE